MTKDMKLRRRLLDVLEASLKVDSTSIGVAVNDGVVTLTGVVPYYIDRITIEQLLKKQPGVHAVANDIDVHVTGVGARTDTELAETVLATLQRQASIASDAVKVTVREGVVTLEGVVPSQAHSDMASQAIRSLPGVTAVYNLFSVRAVPPLSAEQSYGSHGGALVSSAQK
jgi:osmotically-inducible protein OsmY